MRTKFGNVWFPILVNVHIACACTREFDAMKSGRCASIHSFLSFKNYYVTMAYTISKSLKM